LSVPDFVAGDSYHIAYKSVRNISGLDMELTCPSCGNTKWTYHDRTGTGKLSKDRMKFKCTECGQWFICNRADVTKTLGN